MGEQGINQWQRRINILLLGLEETLRRHKDWKLSIFRRCHELSREEWTIFLALLGKELGHVEANDPVLIRSTMPGAPGGTVF